MPDPSPMIPIDADWLATRQAPYLLDVAGATYRLEAEVTTPGTAFVVAADAVTLGLNGHTITYGDAAPLIVPNGDFEAAPTPEAPAPAWDLSGAPNSTFAVSENNFYMQGARVLRWTIPNGAPPQTIRSAPIAVEPGRCYTATCLSSGLATARNYSTRLDVLDATTGQPVADRTAAFGQASFGEGGVTTFHSGPASAVVLALTIVPSASGTAVTTALLDDVRLTFSNVYGILASRASQSRLSGTSSSSEAKGDNKKYSGAANLGTAAPAAYGRASSPSILGPGTIRQGKGAGHYSHPLMLANCPGTIVVRGINTVVTGPDTSSLSASQAAIGGSLTVEGNTFTYAPEIDHQVTLRQALVAAVNVKGSGPARVAKNQIVNNPHLAITFGSTEAGADCLIEDNTITPRTKHTNGYALYPHGIGVTIRGNTITGYTRGLMLETDAKTLHARWLIAGNRIDVRELPNREYGQTALCRALRVRNGAADSGWPGLVIEDNEFTARTAAGLQLEAHGGRFSLVAWPGMMDSGITVRRNLFRGIVEGPDPGPQYKSEGLTLDQLAPGIKPRFEDNRIESDCAGLVLCGGETTVQPVADVTFERTTIRRAEGGQAARAFAPIQAGVFNCPVERIKFLDLDAPADPFKFGGIANKDIEVFPVLRLRIALDDAEDQLETITLPSTTYRGPGQPVATRRTPKRITVEIAP